MRWIVKWSLFYKLKITYQNFTTLNIKFKLRVWLSLLPNWILTVLSETWSCWNRIWAVYCRWHIQLAYSQINHWDHYLDHSYHEYTRDNSSAKAFLRSTRDFEKQCTIISPSLFSWQLQVSCTILGHGMEIEGERYGSERRLSSRRDGWSNMLNWGVCFVWVVRRGWTRTRGLQSNENESGGNTYSQAWPDFYEVRLRLTTYIW